MKDPWLHSLWLKHYGNKAKKEPREVCIRCGSRAILGKKRPFLGLCKKCRKLEFNAMFVIIMMLVAPQISWGATASWYSSADACGPKTNNHKGCPTASGRSIYELERKGVDFAASNDFKLGQKIRACSVRSGKCVEVVVLDRGGFEKYGRSIDLCKHAFARISNTRRGIEEVTLTKIK